MVVFRVSPRAGGKERSAMFPDRLKRVVEFVVILGMTGVQQIVAQIGFGGFKVVA
jgi:hypothetical protein